MDRPLLHVGVAGLSGAGPDDLRSAWDELLARGVPGLQSPHRWLDRLLIAWVEDPDGHPVQLVQHWREPVG